MMLSGVFNEDFDKILNIKLPIVEVVKNTDKIRDNWPAPPALIWIGNPIIIIRYYIDYLTVCL